MGGIVGEAGRQFLEGRASGPHGAGRAALSAMESMRNQPHGRPYEPKLLDMFQDTVQFIQAIVGDH